jgi:mycofactocin system glycosyltransferase
VPDSPMAHPAEVAVPPAGPRDSALPAGTRLRGDPSLEWVSDTLVAGGSPWRLVRLTVNGAGLLAAWLDGAPVSSAPADGALARRLVGAAIVHPVRAAREVHPGEVDVVVPVRNDVHGLEAVLRVVSRSPAVGVTVVDDGSTDPWAVARVADAHQARLVRHDLPLGPGAARNAGLRASTAPVVAFLDADALPAADWLEVLVPYLDDPAVGAVAPRVRGPQGPGVKERFEAAASPLDLGDQRGVVRPGAAVPFVPAAALVARRAALGEGFDASLRTGEDVDLIWRLVASGWEVRYEPSVTVTHAARSTWRGWLAQRFAYGMSAAPLEARHGDAAAPLRADPRVLATLGLVLAGRPRAAAGLLSWSASSLARQLDGVSARGGNQAAARQLAARGTALAAPGLARSAFRAYGPLLLAAAVALPPVRRPVATLTVAATAVRWWRAGRPTPRTAFAALSLVDDLAYGAGVLAGAVRARRVGALRPRLRPTVRVAAPPISRT